MQQHQDKSIIPEAEKKKYRPSPALLLCSFVLSFVLIAVSSFLQKSPTYDEMYHLFAGYSHLKWGDFRTYPEHPPLAKVLAALPLLALDTKDPRPSSPYWDLIPQKHDYGWLVAHQMVFLENDAETLFFYAKLPMITLGIVLGIFVYLWAKELYGIHAGACALFLYGLDPNILAHSSIAHTDIPFTAFFFIGTYFYWRALDRLTWFNLLWTFFFFGLSTITKYSFLTILPIWVILGLVKIFSTEPLGGSIGMSRTVWSCWKKTALSSGILACALIMAYFLIWAAYGFRFNAVAGGEAHRLELAPVWPENFFLRAFAASSNQHHLLPEAWTYGLLYVFRFLKRPVYLLGQVSNDGFWLYFPVAFIVKTPLPTLLLLLATVGRLTSRRKTRMPEIFLLIPIIVYFCFAVWAGLNIGLRHLLPIYPFVFVLVSGSAAELWLNKSFRKKCLLFLLGLWYVWSAIEIYPHYLAYFNELVGGPKNGYKVLTDSSLDWGQDLKGLKRWMVENGVTRIQLAYFGTADPSYYGIDAVYLPGSIIFSPRPDNARPDVPRYMAVSVTYIYGVHSGKPLNGRYLALRGKKPIASIGHSILVYKLG